jgi:hypothetical protein
LVDEETRRYRPTKNYLEPVLPPLTISAFETPLMKTELDRVASRLPMETLSMKRYELPPPPAGKLFIKVISYAYFDAFLKVRLSQNEFMNHPFSKIATEKFEGFLP